MGRAAAPPRRRHRGPGTLPTTARPETIADQITQTTPSHDEGDSSAPRPRRNLAPLRPGGHRHGRTRTRRPESSCLPQHACDRRAAPGLRLPGDLEAEALVEADSARIRGLQVRGQVTVVNGSQARSKYLRPEPASLHGRINAKPRQIPMRIGWMSFLHLA